MIHHSISRMTRYINQINKMYRSNQQDILLKLQWYIIQSAGWQDISIKLTRHIIQGNKIYQLNQQDILLKLPWYIIQIGRIYRQDCKSYQNDWQIRQQLVYPGKSRPFCKGHYKAHCILAVWNIAVKHNLPSHNLSLLYYTTEVCKLQSLGQLNYNCTKPYPLRQISAKLGNSG